MSRLAALASVAALWTGAQAQDEPGTGYDGGTCYTPTGADTQAINDIILKVFAENQMLLEKLDFMHEAACLDDPSSTFCTDYEQHAALSEDGAVLQVAPEYIGLGPYSSPDGPVTDEAAMARGLDDCYLDADEIAADPIADAYVRAWEALRFDEGQNVTVSGLSLDGDSVEQCNMVHLNSGVQMTPNTLVTNPCAITGMLWPGGINECQATGPLAGNSCDGENCCIYNSATSSCEFNPEVGEMQMVYIPVPAVDAAAVGSAGAWSDCFLTADEAVSNEDAMLYAAGVFATQVAINEVNSNGTVTNVIFAEPFPVLAGMPHTEGVVTVDDLEAGCASGETPHWHQLNQSLSISLDPLYITQMMDNLGIDDATISAQDLNCDATASDACADAQLLANSLQAAICTNLGLVDCSMVSITSLIGSTEVNHAQVEVLLGDDAVVPTNDNNGDDLLSLDELTQVAPECVLLNNAATAGQNADACTAAGCVFCDGSTGPDYCVASCTASDTCHTELIQNGETEACVSQSMAFLWALQDAICDTAATCDDASTVEIVSVSAATGDVASIVG